MAYTKAIHRPRKRKKSSGELYRHADETAMTDKELLEYAAKAAGIKGRWGREGYIERNEGFIPKGWRRAWNPLNNDSDALRLAVKLKMLVQVDYSDSFRYVTSAKCWSRELERCVFASEEVEPCPYAATRRAIVRAAYEIGKEKKDE